MPYCSRILSTSISKALFLLSHLRFALTAALQRYSRQGTMDAKYNNLRGNVEELVEGREAHFNSRTLRAHLKQGATKTIANTTTRRT